MTSNLSRLLEPEEEENVLTGARRTRGRGYTGPRRGFSTQGYPEGGVDVKPIGFAPQPDPLVQPIGFAPEPEPIVQPIGFAPESPIDVKPIGFAPPGNYPQRPPGTVTLPPAEETPRFSPPLDPNKKLGLLQLAMGS